MHAFESRSTVLAGCTGEEGDRSRYQSGRHHGTPLGSVESSKTRVEIGCSGESQRRDEHGSSDGTMRRYVGLPIDRKSEYDGSFAASLPRDSSQCDQWGSSDASSSLSSSDSLSDA
jgi:hypothetical protein